MLFGQERHELRHVFIQAWRHYREQQVLQGIEKIIVDVALRHPEYHALLDDPEAVTRDYLSDLGEANPFLHMSMHIALEEQLSIDRPAGIRAHCQQLQRGRGDAHEAQHMILECLGEALWQAQRNGLPPDEAAYLDCVARLSKP